MSPVGSTCVSSSSGQYLCLQWAVLVSLVGSTCVSTGQYLCLQWAVLVSPVGSTCVSTGQYLCLQ